MYFIFKKSNPGFYLLHLGRKQVIILTRKIKMRKMTQQLINRMMGSVEVNINSSQDKTFRAVDSVSDLREKIIIIIVLQCCQFLAYLVTG